MNQKEYEEAMAHAKWYANEIERAYYMAYCHGFKHGKESK